LLIYVPLTVAAMYLAASLLGVSYGILKTAMLKLAAIALFTGSLHLVGDWLGYPISSWLVAALVSLYLFSNCFDLDIRETVLSVIAISVIRFVLLLGIAVLVGLVVAEI
jgi:hypothetical protein